MSWRKISEVSDQGHHLDHIGLDFDEIPRYDASTDHESVHLEQLKRFTMEVLRRTPFAQLSSMDKTWHIQNDHDTIPAPTTSDPVLVDRLMDEAHEAAHASEDGWRDFKSLHHHGEAKSPEYDEAQLADSARRYLRDIREHFRRRKH